MEGVTREEKAVLKEKSVELVYKIQLSGRIDNGKKSVYESTWIAFCHVLELTLDSQRPTAVENVLSHLTQMENAKWLALAQFFQLRQKYGL